TLIHRPDLTIEDVQTSLTQTSQSIAQTIQRWLLRTGLFLPSDQLPGQVGYTGTTVFLIWGMAGLLLTFGGDLVLGQILQARAKLAAATAAAPAITPQSSPKASPPVELPSPVEPVSSVASPLPQLSLQKSGQGGKRTFNASGFTQPGNKSVTLAPSTLSLAAEPLKPKAATVELVARSPYPTFNAQQLDEKLALYDQLLIESGPPDILIIGSSRALRGIDPVTLQKSLAAQGYPGLKVFNFGVNGATAQVVDLVLRQILQPSQLPKLIVWADGARAFNSGRVDITYNAIAVSEGFRRLAEGRPLRATIQANGDSTDAASRGLSPDPSTAVGVGGLPVSKTGAPLNHANSYEAFNAWLDLKLASISASYAQRDQLSILLQEELAKVLPKPKMTVEQTVALQTYQATSPASNEAATPNPLIYTVDEDGFLPLSVRFNPATYYQKYARVAGNFDSDYEDFQLEGKQFEAMGTLLKFLKAQNIPLVFVNLPLTQEYLDSFRLEHEQEFRQSMLRLATEKGFLFRDWSQLWDRTANDYFSDPSHLNRYGAYLVARQLSQDALIPWPEPQR
ncbi:MAG: hypothetical protein VKJ46_13965, partial [Leptolyngbyaceae bacterium]|nr:hypothetical protein [Leptolyngbyaceae bacterium]